MTRTHARINELYIFRFQFCIFFTNLNKLCLYFRLLLCFFQFGTGRFIGHFSHNTVEAGQALGQKNTAFAIWIAAAYLNPLSTVGPGCYIVWQNVINSLEIWSCRRKGNEHYV